MHRDYHPLAQGAQVRVEMYPDRLALINPGGLYGAATPDELLQGTVTSSRNAVLARLLEDVELPGTNRAVCENRGSGIRMIATELSASGLQPPTFRVSSGMFVAELRNSLQQLPPTERPARAGQSGAPPVSVLAALANGPKATLELVRLTGLTRSGVGRQLRDLEAKGLVAPTTERRRSPNIKWATM
ncbi:MAG: ArsR family transcriptional regulator [Propionibacteriaceae bacterium]|nr:ArsR family transcriptional regulator [Propionibacteriaceae bacterium]